MTDLLYKVLGPSGESVNGGNLTWPLPNGKPGKWVSVSKDRELKPCAYGLHLCRPDDLLDWLGPTIWVAEAGKERIEADGKIVVRRARLIAPTHWNERTARLFACDCAERALRNARKAGRHPDPRSCKAVRVARRFANGKATDSAWAAAWAAAGDAAEDAAGDVAWDAAWAAARAAARDVAGDVARDVAWAAAWATARAAAARAAARAAAWDAAGDPERKWQTKRLMEYVNGERG